MPELTVFDRLDADQRLAVSLRKNGAVSAGAGSGKTTVLAARYLDLVFSSGADVRSILCLTFTRKAQAEMQARVWRELSTSTDPLARGQVERFSEASISTIDSFCASVLHSSAQDYGYAPDFAVDDEKARQIALDEALRFLLARREDPALAGLFSRMTFERAWRGLFAEAAYRYSYPATRTEGDFAAMPARAAKALESAAAAAMLSTDSAIEAALLALDEGSATTKKGLETASLFTGLADAITGGCAALGLEKAAAATASLASWNMAAFGRSPTEQALKEAAKAGRDAARTLAGLAKAAADAPLQSAVLGLLAEFAEVYRSAKRSQGIMGFRDAAVCAVDLLARRKDLRTYYKRRYRYIMVDEFQDDDELQKELLYLLAESPDSLAPGIPSPEGLAPDKLFFVGDDKQSIYRFRGADVAVFNRLGAELGGDSPRLRSNYRSEPGLVAFFNELFTRVFDGAEADFEAHYEDALAGADSPGITPTMRLLWKERSSTSGDGDPLRSADEALADGVTRFIAEAVAKGDLLLPDCKGGQRPAGFDDFAVLFRSTSKQYLLERFFRLRKVPYAAQTLRGLFVESPANDIYAALRLALLPSDSTAYAAVLRSPLAAISDNGFVRVLASGLPAFDDRAMVLLSADDGLRFRRGAAIHARLAAMVDREATADLVSFLWFEGGLRLSILRRPDAHPYLEHYDYLYALASQSDGKGECTATFLARLEPLMGKPEKLEDMAAQRESGSGVKIMSVHRSKGLEFPVVILPWLENCGPDDGPGEAFYVSGEAGLTLNLLPFDEPGAVRGNVFYDAARDLDRAQGAAEVKRLFYVACTRAETHLVFAAVKPRNADRRGASFLGLLAGGGGKPDPEGGFTDLPGDVDIAILPDLCEEDYRRLAGGARPRDPASLGGAYAAAGRLDRKAVRHLLPATLLEASSRSTMPEGELLADSPVDAIELPEGLFGTACHALLEAALGGRLLELPGGVLDGVPESQRGLFAAEALRLAMAFLDSPFWRDASSFPRRDCEKGLLLALPEGWIVSCRLDLALESATEVVIVDFKSDRLRVPGAYAMQMAIYKAAFREIAPGKRVRAFLFWLRSAEAEEVLREADQGKILALAVLAAAGRDEEASDEEPASD